MAYWEDVVNYVRSNYKISDENESMLKLLFQTDKTRSQVVFLWRQALMDGREEWVQIESPIGPMTEIDLAALVTRAGTLVCGGIGAVEGVVTYRHSLPLQNLDVNEFERPLLLVTTTADSLEAQFTGGDRF